MASKHSVAPDPAAEALTEDEIARLRGAVLRLARRMRRLSAEEGLTPAQSGLLATLVRQGPTRAGELAAAEGLNPTMLSRIVAALEHDGLVARTPDPGDRRATRVQATDAGAALISRLRARHRAALATLLTGLDTAAVGTLRDALPTLEAMACAEARPARADGDL